jgi:serine/threonine-protein kinase
MSADKEQEYFCEGMAEDILNALTKIEGLRVASRTSAFRFKEEARDLRSIGEALNVKAVLEGSVRTAGNRLRITAELVNVEDGQQVWSERYDREMADVFAIQDEISENIVEALRGKLVGGGEVRQVKRYTENLEAYHLYLKGQYAWNHFYMGSVAKAIQFFEQAGETDPSYVLAHASLAHAYCSLGWFGAFPPKVASAKARAAIEKALAIDDGLAEVRAAQGLIRYYFEFDWSGAEMEYKRALELNPSYVAAHAAYSQLLGTLGRFDDALAEAKRGQKLDPLSPFTNATVGINYLINGDTERATVELEKALELDAHHVQALLFLGTAHIRNSRFDDAVSVLEHSAAVGGRTSMQLGVLGWAYGEAGRQDDARRILQELQARAEQTYVSPTFFVFAYIGCNETEQAFESLEKAYQERSPVITFWPADWYDALRSDPRYEDVLGRLNLSGLTLKR